MRAWGAPAPEHLPQPHPGLLPRPGVGTSHPPHAPRPALLEPRVRLPRGAAAPKHNPMVPPLGIHAPVSPTRCTLAALGDHRLPPAVAHRCQCRVPRPRALPVSALVWGVMFDIHQWYRFVALNLDIPVPVVLRATGPSTYPRAPRAPQVRLQSCYCPPQFPDVPVARPRTGGWWTHRRVPGAAGCDSGRVGHLRVPANGLNSGASLVRSSEKVVFVKTPWAITASACCSCCHYWWYFKEIFG